jgi:acetoin utilization deacetylase AcuC-like enzyme
MMSSSPTRFDGAAMKPVLHCAHPLSQPILYPSSVSPAGFLSHERFYWHDTGRWAGVYAPGPLAQPLGHVESEESKRRIENLLALTGILDQLVRVTPRPATDDELCNVHTLAYVQRIDELCAAGGGDAGVSVPVGFHSAAAARLGAGGVIEAVEAAFGGGPQKTYCLVRPPGHHAERETAMGYCVFNNVAIGAHAAKRHGARVAIVDWDVHHGNGTQQAFWPDPDVLFISLHQDGLFPLRSGNVTDIGAPDAEGSVINVPLPAGSGHGAYVHAFDQVVVPALRAFAPSIILVSAGQDGGFYDPMARQMCLAMTYRHMANRLVEAADELCGGRVVATHEGGYSAFHTPFLTAAIVCELAGLPPIDDPSERWTLDVPGHDLQPHQEARIGEVLAAHRPFGLIG